METLFRKVLVSERRPTKNGFYITETNLGLTMKKTYNSERESFVHQDFHGDIVNIKNIEYWYEPVELPSNEEILHANKELVDMLEEAKRVLSGVQSPATPAIFCVRDISELLNKQSSTK